PTHGPCSGNVVVVLVDRWLSADGERIQRVHAERAQPPAIRSPGISQPALGTATQEHRGPHRGVGSSTGPWDAVAQCDDQVRSRSPTRTPAGRRRDPLHARTATSLNPGVSLARAVVLDRSDNERQPCDDMLPCRYVRKRKRDRQATAVPDRWLLP